MARKDPCYRTKATVKFTDGREQTSYYSFTTEDYMVMFHKLLEPKGAKLVSVEAITPEPMKYYS